MTLRLNHFIKFFIILAAILIVNLLVINNFSPQQYEKIDVAFNINAEKIFQIQIFYSNNESFTEENSETEKYDKKGYSERFQVGVPNDTKVIRVDFGTISNKINISDIQVKIGSSYIVPKYSVKDKNDLDILDGKIDKIGMNLVSAAGDPYIIINLDEIDLVLQEIADSEATFKKIVFIIFFDVLFILLWCLRKKINLVYSEIINAKILIFDLAKNDFKVRFAGSYLGIIWAFVQPVITILVYWFVFQVGFKSGGVNGVPYALWLSAGLIPWFFFSETLNSGTNSLLEYSYLVKKVVFKIDILPIVKIISSLFVHVFFVAFLALIFLINGIKPTLYWVQLVYYSFCMVALLYGLILITSGLVVFFRDLTQIIGVILQIGVWMTPIMWNSNILSDRLQVLIKLNPMYYIVNGYRECLIDNKWFWYSTFETIYFWVFTFVVIMAGEKLFKNLKSHFADVL